MEFGLFAAAERDASPLDAATPRLIRVPAAAKEVVQHTDASLVLYRIYQDKFRRGQQQRQDN